jgi:DNA-binding HxlR family transcriptional regulator
MRTRNSEHAKLESEQTILRSLRSKSPQRWSELLKDTNISSRTLKKALERLEKKKLVCRQVDQGRKYPPPVRYSLSRKGIETVDPQLFSADVAEVNNAVKNLENLSSDLISDPNRLRKWYTEERDANWNELVNNPQKKSFQERGNEFIQKEAELQRPIFNTLRSMHKIICNISLKDIPKSEADYNSHVTVVKDGYPYLVPAELLRGLDYPFTLAYIGVPTEVTKEIQKKNAKLSDEIFELCGIKKEKRLQ